jgi:hypothetical protein
MSLPASRRIVRIVFVVLMTIPMAYVSGDERATVELPAEKLRDKIRGGLLGQLLGNLNGLDHEMKYIDVPGNVSDYTPSLPAGARTDDDTDFEWVYLYEMQQQNEIVLSPEKIVELWTSRINRRIWCSNQYARQLMDLGLKPPLTGCSVLNPWADFNISGQFLCESFGLLAPAMPQTASRIALNYTTVAIDLEPAQTTQLFASMIATAFVEDDFQSILDSGLLAVDKRSRLHEIIGNVRQWHRQYPHDWRTTRRLLKTTYSQVDGGMRDRNGYELNTGSTIAALLYGDGDFVKTLITAFNFGWDADNTAATAGTIIGVTKGYRWMMSQGWQIVDRYQNTTRENMPNDETITSFADRLVDLAEQVISKNGGVRETNRGKTIYRIPAETARCVQTLPQIEEQIFSLRRQLTETTRQSIVSGRSSQQQAQGAYIAICLDLTQGIRQDFPQEWNAAIASLAKYQNVVQAIFYHADVPAGDRLRQQATEAGLQKPARREKLW